MSEEGFLRAIAEAPEDDTPRLVYADWLEEHGEGERAEFIRLQVESDRTDVYDPRSVEFADREAELLARHEKKWLTRLKPHLAEWKFRRGLLDEVTVRVEMLLKHAGKLARHPIRTMTLRFEPGDVDRADQVAACAALANVETLAVECRSGLTATALGQFAASKCLGRVKHLNLTDTRLNDSGVQALAAGQVARHLESLDLSENSVGAAGVEALARGEMERLKTLRLSRCRPGNAGVQALTSSRRLPMLHALDLSENGLEVASARALAGCARLAGLRRLNLAGNRIGRAGAAVLARSRHLRKLEAIQLRSNGIGKAGAAELGKGGFLDSMHYLELSGNGLGDAGLRSIMESSPPRLEFFLLGTDELDDDSMRLLARWPALASVRELNLYNNRVSAFGMRALVDSPYAKSLCRMNLECNKLKDAGVEVLAGWPGLAGMRWLKLRQNEITQKGALALARSPHLSFMTDLDLSYNDVEGAKEAFTTPPLRQRIRRQAPWDTDQIDYYPPFTPWRPRG